jgi:uncharacterized protein YrrD
MQYKQNTPVYTLSGESVGQIDRVVMDPKTREVTYLVVRKGFLFTEDKVVPIESVREATEERVTLSQEVGNLDSLPAFEETQYLPADWEEDEKHVGADFNPASADKAHAMTSAPSLFWYPTIGMQMLGDRPALGPAYVTRIETNIPENEVAIKPGASVMTRDDKAVGSVEEIITHAQENKVTHFVMSHGLIFKTHKAIPVQWVSEVTEDAVKLGVHSDMLERLPEYQAQAVS